MILIPYLEKYMEPESKNESETWLKWTETPSSPVMAGNGKVPWCCSRHFVHKHCCGNVPEGMGQPLLPLYYTNPTSQASCCCIAITGFRHCI